MVSHKAHGQGMSKVTETKTIEQVIGENMRRLRGEQSQGDFGQRVGDLLGKAWSAQVVSAAESGKRSFIAAETVALCTVFDCAMTDLYQVDAGTDIRITQNLTIPGTTLQMVAAGVSDESLRNFLGTMLPELKRMNGILWELEVDMGQFQRNLRGASLRMAEITDHWTQSVPVPATSDPKESLPDDDDSRNDA